MSRKLAEMLKEQKAYILIYDSWDENNSPKFRIEKVTSCTSFGNCWCVGFTAVKMADGHVCNGVATDCVLGYAFGGVYNVDNLSKWLEKRYAKGSYHNGVFRPEEKIHRHWQNVMRNISQGYSPELAIQLSISPVANWADVTVELLGKKLESISHISCMHPIRFEAMPLPFFCQVDMRELMKEYEKKMAKELNDRKNIHITIDRIAADVAIKIISRVLHQAADIEMKKSFKAAYEKAGTSPDRVKSRIRNLIKELNRLLELAHEYDMCINVVPFSLHPESRCIYRWHA